jgi:hypothetical protein
MNYWRSVFIILSDCRKWGTPLAVSSGDSNAGPKSESLVESFVARWKMIYPSVTHKFRLTDSLEWA